MKGTWPAGSVALRMAEPTPADDESASVTSGSTSSSEGGLRQTVMLILPRADHLRGYRPLVHALAAALEIDTVVVTSPQLPGALTDVARAMYHRCPFYCEGSSGRVLEWVWLLVRREWTARKLLARVRLPAVLAVPSDVSDVMLPFVEGARRRGVPVVYVQGAVVFPDYPELNARAYAERRQAMPVARRLLLAVISLVLKMCGIHAAIETKGVIGSRSERVLLMNETQIEIHRRAGVPAERVRVTGAPFVDDLVTLRQRFDAAARDGVRHALGLGDRPVALFVSKSRFSLGWVNREIHQTVIGEVVRAIRRELPGWACVVKLHPNETTSDYEWLIDAADPFVRVIKEHPVEELLLLSDLTLSLGTSSPAFTATILGRPLILVNFSGASMLDAHGDLVAAAKTVRSASELRYALRQIAEDPQALARLKIPSVVEEAWADGKACERIVAHLRSLA